MTFSIVARDDTGAVGVALSSSSPAVAARCIHVRGDAGAVASQNITDPRYGGTLLDAMRSGRDPRDAMDSLVRSDPSSPYRQILAIDRSGRTAVFSGAQTLGRHAAVQSDGVVAAGNLLATTSVPGAMVTAFSTAAGDLESRLLAALVAGLEAGGEEGEVHSCGLTVSRNCGWNETDLRVDWAKHDPIKELGELLQIWMPQRDDYVLRGIHPQTAPSYGVPGNE